MKRIRKNYPAKFKAKLALETLNGNKTIAEIASIYKVHPTQLVNWKKMIVDFSQDLFIDQRKKHDRTKDELIDELYRQIGQLKVDLEWLKKKSGLELQG